MSSQAIFEIKNLKKKYKHKLVLDDITFDIAKNEFLGIVGKSGAGKSTLMNILAGMEKDYEGSITLHQKQFDIQHKKANVSKHIGFSFQPYSFYEDLTMRENLMYFGKIYGMKRNDILKRAQLLFNLTDLDASDMKNKVSNLSGGMKKRFDIVCSLLHNPKVLILDEPTVGLDPLRRKQLLKILQRIHKSGVTILLCSHIMSDVNDLCDRILLIEGGKIMLLDTPRHIKENFLQHEKITIKSYPAKYNKLLKHISSFNIVHAYEEDGKLMILTPEADMMLHFILHILEEAGEHLEDITVAEPELSEVFDAIDATQRKNNSILKQNIKKVNEFIYKLVKKKYSEKKVKEIMTSHKWPKEVVDVLVSKRLLSLKEEGK